MYGKQVKKRSSSVNAAGSKPRWILCFALLFLIATAGLLFTLRNLGEWLQIDEPLRRSSAIAVLGGGVPFRAMEAASLYGRGWASEVWLTQASPNEADRALEKLGVAVIPEHEYSRLVLKKLGVPDAAIHLIPEHVDNTATEIKAIFRYAQALPAAGRTTNSVILVTSKVHTRRVRVIWNAFAPGSQMAIVRYTPLEPFDGRRWWRTTTDALATFREAFGILNAWAGFPIAPRER
jgi:hypothetical protein